MKRVVLQYKVKPDHGERNAQLIRGLFDELDRSQPDGLRYAALRLTDGVTFIHITEESEDGQSPLATLESAERFRAGVAECFAEPATAQQSSEVSFRLFTSSSPKMETRL
jgi:hypothetical protein